MVALIVILTFAIAILVDYAINGRPLLAREEPTRPEPVLARPRLTPALVGGFELPVNLKYHPGHTWVVAEGADMVRVGIDDFAAKLAGPVTKIDIPERGQWIRQGQRIIALHRDGRELDLVSPIEGTVVAINEKALEDPSITRSDPYGDGWLIAVNSPDARTNFRNLLSGGFARRWMDESAAQLREYLGAARPHAQDGGVAVDDLLGQLPMETWTQVAHELFLNP